MMKKRYLTPSEIQRFDPFGLNRATIDRFRSCQRLVTEKPSRFVRISPDEFIGRYQDILQRQADGFKSRHTSYLEYNQEMFAKTGPQGGTYEFDTMIKLLTDCYTLAARPITVNSTYYAGLDYLKQRVREAIEVYGYPQEVPLQVFATNAALPTGLKKGTYHAETIGAAPFWRHCWPDLLGQRYMRGKKRVIHQDSVLNVRYVERTLSKVRRWLKTYLPDLFSAWLRPDAYMTPAITRMIDRQFVSIETDYEAMDNHFSLEFAQIMVLPIYELLLDEGEYLHLAAYVEEAFHQEVFMGTYCFTGLHNLFSGQGLTNDFETISSVELSCGAALQCGSDPRYLLIIANGDDISLVLDRAKGSGSKLVDPREVMDTMIAAAELAGLTMSKEKCRMSDKDIHFCRKVYYREGKRDMNSHLYGAYPSILSVNNIVQPERPNSQPGLAAIADLQRLDNCYGSPDWKLVCDLTKRFTTHDFVFSEKDLDESRVDWWEKVYGERWSPESSPSFVLITQEHK